MRFTKMHGAGNDYVYVDAARETLPLPPDELARLVSDRQFGIGSDGLVLICPSDVADAKMRMFNSDGSESEMCGNAVRCVAKYVADRNVGRPRQLKIETGIGVLTLDCEYADAAVRRVRVDMGEPTLVPEKIPTTLRATSGNPIAPAADLPIAALGLGLEERLGDAKLTCVSTGNPHCVVFVDEIADEAVLGAGPIIETSLENFPRKTNVEFVQVVSRDEIRMRVWERGTGETLACGTGSCASAVASALTGRTDRRVLVRLRGGDLEIEWNAENNRIFMTGPAVETFSGELTREFFANRRPQ